MSRLLRTVVVNDLLKLADELAVLLLLPSFVGSFNAIFHLLKSLLQHLGEVVVHRLNVVLELSKFFLLLILRLLYLRFNFLFFLLQSFNGFLVLINALFKLGLVLSQLLIS